MTTWYVYILRCADGSLYTGIAVDLEKRFAVHQRGRGAKYTRGRLPVKLVYQEHSGSKGEALRREAQIKKFTKRQKEALVCRQKTAAQEAAATRGIG